MTHVRASTVAALAALLVAGLAPAGVRAATPSAPATITPAERHDWERSHRVSKILGSDIHNKAGEKIGEIRDVVVDDKGTITLAIVSTGGFLGVGDRLHAIPWDVLTLGAKDDRVLDIDKARLAQAPGFTSRTWPNLGDDHWMADNRRYFVH